MANDSMLKFRLGVFVLGSLLLLAMLIVLFGEMPDFFRSQIHYALKIPQAPGVVEGTPVRKSGIRIGEIASVALNPETGEVTLGFVVQKRFQLRTTDEMTLARTLVLGETAVNFTPKPQAGGGPAPEGFVFQGRIPEDLVQAITEARDLVPMGREAIEAIRDAAREFQRLAPEVRRSNSELQVTLNNVGRAAESLDNLLRTNNEQITSALNNFAKTMGELGNLLTPENQRKLARLIDNAAAVSDRLPAFFSDENRANLQTTLKNASQASDNLAELLNEQNRKTATRTLENLSDASDRMAKVFSAENQKNLSDGLANLKKSSERLDTVMDNINAASADARTSMKTLTERIERVSGQVEEGVKEARGVIKRVGESTGRFEEAMVNIRDVAKMVGERAPGVLRNIEDASGRISQVSQDVGEFTKSLTTGNGTVRRLVTDPALYNSMNDAARAASVSMARLERIAKDLEIFADKLARHPELIGVRGAVAPGSGIK
jgi:phospholipid/cholesterol/gamma-HCH transport system substrate-binding protein